MTNTSYVPFRTSRPGSSPKADREAPSNALLTPLALRIASLSEAEWGRSGIVRIVGTAGPLTEALTRLERFARVDRPVLITGESGVGKELFSRAAYLLSPRLGQPFLSVNCAQFTDENLLISELFGHKKGAFTGATADRKGLFEEADGGVLFMDEVGELTPKAQAALLRAIGIGEIVRLGESKARRVDVRVVAATNRDLKRMAAEGAFREDLYYRLGYLRLRIPPVRERGDDWRLIAETYLMELQRKHREQKRLSDAAIERLAAYHWPGNVREIRGLLDMAFCLCLGPEIEPRDFEEELEPDFEEGLLDDEMLEYVSGGSSSSFEAESTYRRMVRGEATFWTAVREPFLDREMNRDEVRRVIERVLTESGGSYKRALRLFGLGPGEYLKFMDFLRHHRLKPQRFRRGTSAEHV